MNAATALNRKIVCPMEMLRRIFLKLRELPLIVIGGIGGAVALVLVLYYPIGMLLVHKVDDNTDFTGEAFTVQNGSAAVSVAVALVDRETRQYRWTPNAPVFSPAAPLDRMPSFQRGVISGISRFAIEMKDEIGRTRGSSQVDADLEKAAGQLNYRPDVWLFDFSTSILPTTSSEKQYQGGIKALQNYNQRLSRGEAVFERRADNLLETLDKFSADLGSSSAAIENHIQANRNRLLDTSADQLYYYNKGRMYAYYLVIRELEKDFASIIKEKQLQTAWKQMLDSLREGAQMRSFFVFCMNPDSQFLPNHLAQQGFYLLRARTQLREITNILLK